MPDHRLEGFRVRCDVRRVHRGNQHASIGNGCGVTAVAAYDADDFCSNRLRIFQRGNQVRAYVLRNISAAHGENQQQIIGPQAAGAQPAIEDRTPAFIVSARGKLRHVIGGCVSLDAGDFAEIVDGVRSIGGASAHPENEQSAADGASAGDEGRCLFDARQIQLRDDLGRFGEKLLGKALFIKAAAAHFRTAPGRLKKLPVSFNPAGEPIS